MAAGPGPTGGQGCQGWGSHPASQTGEPGSHSLCPNSVLEEQLALYLTPPELVWLPMSRALAGSEVRLARCLGLGFCAFSVGRRIGPQFRKL